MLITLKNDPVKAKQFFEDKMAFTTGPVELSHKIQNNEEIVIVDVRAAQDYQQGHVPGAINLPKEKWADAEEILNKDKVNALYCYSQTCHLATSAAFEFASRGYPVMEMEGGFKAWKENNLEVQK